LRRRVKMPPQGAALRDRSAQRVHEALSVTRRIEILRDWEKTLAQVEDFAHASAGLTGLVMLILEHHQNTAEIPYNADKIDFTDVLLVHRQVLDVLRELLDARTALRVNQVTLESIAG
jgi:hypothetical protein